MAFSYIGGQIQTSRLAYEVHLLSLHPWGSPVLLCDLQEASSAPVSLDETTISVYALTDSDLIISCLVFICLAVLGLSCGT